jgi:hypothetical protein
VAQDYGIDVSEATIIPTHTPLNASHRDFAMELKEALDESPLAERPMSLLMSDDPLAPGLPSCTGTWAEFGVYGESICPRGSFALPA